MVSLTLGLIMLTAVMQIMINTKQDYIVHDAMTSLEESGQYIMEKIGADTRNIGFMGCNSTGQVQFESLLTNNPTLSVQQGISGVDGNSTGATPSFNVNTWHDLSSFTLNGNTYNGARQSDIFQFWAIEPYAMAVNSIVALNVASVITINTNTTQLIEQFQGSNVNKLLLLTDCEKSFLVKANVVSRLFSYGFIVLDNVTDYTKLQTLNQPIEAFFLKGGAYYIGKLNNSNNNSPTLYYANIDAQGNAVNKQPLVEGVANLQVLYEEKNTSVTGDTIAYLSANQVQNWSNIENIRLNILLETINNNIIPGSGSLSFYHTGQFINSTDRRLRRSFIATISLRNKQLN